jgi:hypothetical protein
MTGGGTKEKSDVPGYALMSLSGKPSCGIYAS